MHPDEVGIRILCSIITWREKAMKNEKKYGILIYRFIMLLSILLILLLIVDGIIFLRTGYFHVFLNFLSYFSHNPLVVYQHIV